MERRLAAILAADVVGSTRLMGLDEAGTLRHLNELRQKILDPLIAEHNGRTVKLMGDGMLVEFASVVETASVGHSPSARTKTGFVLSGLSVKSCRRPMSVVRSRGEPAQLRAAGPCRRVPRGCILWNRPGASTAIRGESPPRRLFA